jgi:hypothetical protein
MSSVGLGFDRPSNILTGSAHGCLPWRTAARAFPLPRTIQRGISRGKGMTLLPATMKETPFA